jgi:UDP-N-acetylglucosamine 4,6-dehydratase
LVSEDEARNAIDLEDMFIVKPPSPWYFDNSWPDGHKLPDGFCYTSDTNTEWLNTAVFQELIEDNHRSPKQPVYNSR